jgi:hypothetical protein
MESHQVDLSFPEISAGDSTPHSPETDRTRPERKSKKEKKKERKKRDLSILMVDPCVCVPILSGSDSSTLQT